jgi:hypothetical protein
MNDGQFSDHGRAQPFEFACRALQTYRDNELVQFVRPHSEFGNEWFWILRNLSCSLPYRFIRRLSRGRPRRLGLCSRASDLPGA